MVFSKNIDESTVIVNKIKKYYLDRQVSFYQRGTRKLKRIFKL